MNDVPPKKTINLAITTELLDQFNSICDTYGHGKQKGMVLSAAILMFIRTDPQTQGQYMQEVITADIEAGVRTMIDRAKTEQGLRIATREAHERAINLTTNSPPARRPAKAAKKVTKSKKGITRLPKLDDYQ